MNTLVNAASWVVGKALAPVTDTVLEAWAASAGLGKNIEALKMELLYVQAILRPWSCRREIEDNPSLEKLLQMLLDHGYEAEDVLDELDYFRIQDELHGTFEAANKHNDCCQELVLNARHTTKAVLNKLLCSSACSSAAATPGGAKHADQEANAGCMRQLVSGACNTVRHVGKRLPCSSPTPVRDDNDGDHSSMLTNPVGGNAIYEAPQRRAVQTPKLKFNRVDISNRMRLVVDQLQSKRREVSEILRTISSNWNTVPDIANSRPNTTSGSIEPKLYGRDLIMNGIIHDIIEGKHCDKDLIVLPIVGPGGIGKTTLAQHIYHNPRVKKHFQVMVWKCVSLNFNVDKLTKDIEKCIPEVHNEKRGTTVEMIGQRLESKRFMLVLDDIWKWGDEDEWKRLLLPFKKSKVKGNVIIVTTRFPAIANMVKTIDHSIELEGLDHEEFKKLFLAFVFGDGQSFKDHTELLETGHKIMDKLKGSPLAAKTVGRLLRKNLDLDHWTRVLESKEWELQTGNHDIMPALKLSYDYLPFHLQQCFCYCALFPQDYKFDSTELIHFWLGQDILHSGDQKNLTDEDIGLQKINDLVSHGFFKKEEADGYPYYFIHDLLHDLALKVASHECLSVHLYDMTSGLIQPSVRHLSIILDSSDESDISTYENIIQGELRKLSTRLRVGNLRSLMIFGLQKYNLMNIFNDMFREANALRLLALPILTYPMESLLHNFSTVVHLRYLRFGPSLLRIQDLPSMLSRFYHLKILDLEHWTGSCEFPKDISNLLNLIHFLTPLDVFHSDISNVGRLHFLQELKMFQVKKESNGFELQQLRNLIELRELGIYHLEKVKAKEEAIEAKIIDKKYLQKLTLEWDTSRSNIEHTMEALVLECLQPHRKLHELSITGNGGPSCPSWLGGQLSKTLQSLHLVDIHWEVLPPLAHMWLLQELTLEHIPALKEFGPSHFGSITEQSFRKLKKLRVSSLQHLENWALGDSCHLLYQLEVLMIIDCPNLLGLPFDNILHPRKDGLEETLLWFPNLQVLEIEQCPHVTSLPPIPWTRSLCTVRITNVASMLIESIILHPTKSLRITGKNDWHTQDEQILIFDNLIDLQELSMMCCPPLELKHLQMLNSLERLSVEDSSHVFGLGSLVSEGKSFQKERNGPKVKLELPVRSLFIEKCGASGKELTELIFHLPKLKELNINNCEKITWMVVALEHQDKAEIVFLPSFQALTKDHTQTICHESQIEVINVEREENIDDGFLIFPPHLSDSLEELVICGCPDLRLATYPVHMDYYSGAINKVGGRGTVGGGLHALHSLKDLITNCPRFLSAYKTSSCCPFPSSLNTLRLIGVEDMGTLESLSNLTSLTQLTIYYRGKDLRSDGLWDLIMRSQLSWLRVSAGPRFFVGSDPTRGIQDKYQGQLHRSIELELETDDVTGVLIAPICKFLSSFLTELSFNNNEEVECFTQEQEDSFQLLTSLQKLQFFGCDKLQGLPKSINRLPNLKQLRIDHCPTLNSLPEDGLPRSLRLLILSFCDNEELVQKCINYVKNHPQIAIC